MKLNAHRRQVLTDEDKFFARFVPSQHKHTLNEIQNKTAIPEVGQPKTTRVLIEH
jgi:hypothetical protein